MAAEGIDKKQDIFRKILCFVFAMVSTLSLNMRNGLYVGHCPENRIGNVISRIYSAFGSAEYGDIITFFALYVFFLWGYKHFRKVSISGVFVSGLMAVMYVLAVFYRNFNSTEYIWCDAFQLFAAVFEVLGIGTLIYFLLNTLEWYFISRQELQQGMENAEAGSVWKEHFFAISFHFIFLCYLGWLILTYPGSTNPDAIVQLKNFYGDMPRSAWQPPFSTLIMGGLFQLGKILVNANFGFFLYNLFQGFVGALVFSYSLSRLVKRRVPFIVPVAGMLYFGLTPMWGAYVQWFEKDFLYTVSVVLFVTLLAEVLWEKRCSGKMLICICLSGILMALLRSNGIFVIVPTLIVAGIYMAGKGRKQIFTALAVIFVSYEIVVRAVYPAMGIAKASVAETIGVMFQATARYVQEYPEELTAYEKEVISQNFQSVDNLYNYNPRIIDSVKIYYNHSNFEGYLKIWLDMLKKHPGVYLESYLNGSYGYMAPVSVDIGAYIMLEEYDAYLQGHGLTHVENGNLNYIAVWLWNLNNGLPLLRYLAFPGLYTWFTIAAFWVLFKNKKREGMILLIPNLVNILVCTASPLADAMRYALPTVAVVPFMIGWLFVALGSESFCGGVYESESCFKKCD